jgi:hypothetical protein
MKITVENSSMSEQLNPQPANAPAASPAFFQTPSSPYSKNSSMEQLIFKALLKNIPIFLMTLMLIFLVACSAEPKRESAGQYLDDTVITARVKTAILKEDALKVSEINVETYKGVVQLSGFVSSRADRNKAIRVAKKLEASSR